MSEIPDWDPVAYGRNARFVSDLAGQLVSLLDPRPGERILDLGCGDGALTERLAAAGAAMVGVDRSETLVAAARARGLVVHVGDAQALPYHGEFDAVFSNAALHWVEDLDGALCGCYRALRPGGRLAVEMGGDGNIQTVQAALDRVLGRRGLSAAALSPWTFPTREEIRRRLVRAGFDVTVVERIERPTPLPGSLEEWLAIFGRHHYAALPEADRRAALLETAAESRPLQQADGTWVVDYVRLRFLAVRPHEERAPT